MNNMQQAIRAAVRMKVHIISMSWTLDPPGNDAERRDLDNAIGEAANEDILMFCSASDRGANQTATYPSKAAPNKIFTIGAASAWGAADQWIGSLSSIDLTFPGDRVELPGAADAATATIKTASGSSVATALGAGLAALILYCVQVRYALAPDARAKTRADFKKLQKHENMLRAIKDIGTTENSNHKFVEVWELFGKKVAKKDSIGQDKWIDLVADVGITLCSKF
jgi:subtilisin family serine protease